MWSWKVHSAYELEIRNADEGPGDSKPLQGNYFMGDGEGMIYADDVRPALVHRAHFPDIQRTVKRCNSRGGT